jgi:hypothetical protein
MYSAEAKRSVIVRSRDERRKTIALEQLAATFGLTFTEDRAANGLITTLRREAKRIFAFPGQSFVRAAGKIIALDGPLQRETQCVDGANRLFDEGPRSRLGSIDRDSDGRPS